MLSRTDTPLLILLIILGLAAVGLGYLQIRGAIYTPFIGVQGRKLPTQTEVLAALKSQDTDKDGLSDFDEKFVHRTSVYITDSDSDGFSDREEVEAKSNPLDPRSTPLNKLVTFEEPFSEQIFEPPRSEETSPSGGLAEEEASIRQIRDLLVNRGGLSQSVVDKLDDRTLIKLYNETKQETGIDLEKLETSGETISQFSDLDINQLRQLLIAQGADKEMLEQIDDESLKLLFLQALQQPAPLP